MSDSLWSHGLQPSRLLCPWGFPGKNTRVGFHFLFQGPSRHRDWTWVSRITGRFFTVWATREVRTWTWTLLSRVQLFASPWVVHGILQARILEWVAFPFSRGSSQPRKISTQFNWLMAWLNEIITYTACYTEELFFSSFYFSLSWLTKILHPYLRLVRFLSAGVITLDDRIYWGGKSGDLILTKCWDWQMYKALTKRKWETKSNVT